MTDLESLIWLVFKKQAEIDGGYLVGCASRTAVIQLIAEAIEKHYILLPLEVGDTITEETMLHFFYDYTGRLSVQDQDPYDTTRHDSGFTISIYPDGDVQYYVYDADSTCYYVCRSGHDLPAYMLDLICDFVYKET